MIKQERKFGAMPDWAKSGPISAKNYHYRAEAFCASKSAERKGEHPTITRRSTEFLAWQEYFDRWLCGRPTVFQRLLDYVGEGDGPEMTVPEPLPQWFDPSFVPTKNWQPRPVIEELPSRFVPRNRANVFVPFANMLYPLMLERSKTADPLDWRFDDERPGIWVGRNWLESLTAGTRAPKPYTAADFRADEEKLKAWQAKAEQSAKKADDAA
jgi:hypothetical protein